MADEQLALMAHLLRRAGAGASREELEEYAKRPYEEVVEDLLHPERFPEPDEDLIRRYCPTLTNADTPIIWAGHWIYRMVNTRRPLEEKMALFWHHVLATGWFKAEHASSMVAQIQMFRENGLENLRTILTDVSKDPAMICWLDNCENLATASNENYGRELLELFSMGIGGYTETDVKMAARAFTGWTFQQPIPLYPYGQFPSQFEYHEDEHDDSEKTFLGHSGRFNGEDVIDIIVQQEATARFISRHLYNFFVADEPQVPAWSVTPPQDPEAVETLVRAYFDSDADMRSVMRTLLTSDFFRAARFKRVKSPAEFVAGTLKLSGELRAPEPAVGELGDVAAAMGQKLYDPPSVEGWHTGKEWIDGGTLIERVNFAVSHLRDVSKPGPRAIVERLSEGGGPVGPDDFVDRCLDLLGPLEVSAETRAALLEFAQDGGDLRFNSKKARRSSEARVGRMLGLIAAAPEYQFA